MARVVLKMSGEAIIDVDGEGVISIPRLESFAEQVSAALSADKTLQLAIVVGGGNIVRGKAMEGDVVDRTTADYMGMLATIINALPLKHSLEHRGAECRILSGIEVAKVAEPFIQGRAMRHLEKGRVLIFAAGLGTPFFTTDTAAALRASEIGADLLLMAKFGTDGVYDKDPRKYADALKYRQMSYDDFVEKKLQVMDGEAVSLCRSNHVPIYVFDTEAEEAVLGALLGEMDAGTYIGDCATEVRRTDEPLEALTARWGSQR
jgi:uridylate kinase